MAGYVQVINTIKPKNGLDFPVVEAIDVFVEGYTSLADAVTHFATDAMITAINAALSGKANTSDVNTATASLQAQIDQIAQSAGTGTADTEIAQARVDADGTAYATLKARIDAVDNAVKTKADSVSLDATNSDLNELRIATSEYFCATELTASNYYRQFSKTLEEGENYLLRITSPTTGNYTLATATAASSSTLVDTVGTFDFTANVPVYADYTPTADVDFVRLWIADNAGWSVDVYVRNAKIDTITTDISNNTAAIAEADDQIDELEKLYSAFDTVQNQNRLDESALIVGKRLDDNGDLVDGETWSTTDYIPIAENETLYFSVYTDGERKAAAMFFVCEYSSNRTLINYTQYGETYITGSEDGFVRFCFRPSGKEDLMFSPNSDVTYYDEYGYTYEVKGLEVIEEELSETEQQVSELEPLLDAFDKVQNLNRLDESALVADKYLNENGEYVNGSGWNTTDFMPVIANETVYFSCDNEGTRQATNMYFICEYNSEKEVINFTQYGDTSLTPSTTGFIRICFRPGEKTDFMLSENSNISYYDKYGYTYIPKNTGKPYKDIVWAVVGDSMTEHNSAAETHYYDYISDELGFLVDVYGVSGTGYAAQKDVLKAFYQRILAIDKEFDVLTILGSVNDMAVLNEVPLGEYTDSGTSTIGGCINAAIDSFYEIAPLKKLGIISQPPSIGTANNGNLYTSVAQQYTDLLAQICKNRGIPFLNLYNTSGLRPWNEAYRVEYYNENGRQDTGVHPNSKGQKLMSTSIREFMKSLM